MKRRKQTGKDKEEMVASTDKTDSELCPVCGWELVNARSGIWCLNPECDVIDDTDNYR